MDPLAKKYPHLTAYNYVGNKPINSIDIDGLQGQNESEQPKDNKQFFEDRQKAIDSGCGVTIFIHGDTDEGMASITYEGEEPTSYNCSKRAESLTDNPSGVEFNYLPQLSYDNQLTILKEYNFGDCLNPSTIVHNLLYLTYSGGDNPRSYNG